MPNHLIHKYSVIARGFHWSVALLILGMLPLGFLMNNLNTYTLHKSIGLFILTLMIGRTAWRLTHRPPSHRSLPSILRLAAYLSHLALYLAIFTMTLSGWVMATASGRPPRFFGLVELPMPCIPRHVELAGLANETHKLFAWVIIGLVSLHILAALYHHFVRRDSVLSSMV